MSLELDSVLRADILDRHPAFGLSILASAHRLNTASEDDQGGLFTKSLLKVLSGECAINRTDPLLGLGDIVRKLPGSPRLKLQGPTFWDLNLMGPEFILSKSLHCGAPTEGVGISGVLTIRILY